MVDMPNTPFVPFIPSPTTAPEQPKSAKPTGRRKTTAKAPEVPPVAKPPRKKREVKPAKRAPKFDLQTILAVASQLKEADMAAFEKMLGQCQDLGKASRTRVLAALGKVFS